MRLALAILAATAATAVFLFSPQPINSQDAAQPGEQFRVSVGWQDTEPKQWNGRVTVTGAALAQLAGWRFSQTDFASNDGAFDFKTKRGPLENQLRQGAPFGQTPWDSPDIQRLIPQGLIIRTNGPAAVIAIDAPSGSLSFRPSQIAFGGSLSALNGNGRVERLPVESKLSEAGKSDDYPALAVTPDGARWTAWLSYEKGADRILVSHGGKIDTLTEPGDHHAPAIAYDGKGRVQVVWSRNDNGVFHLYGRAFSGGRWSAAEKLTNAGGSNIWPALASDGDGKLALVWQAFRGTQSVIAGRQFANGTWGAETTLSEGPSNAWTPAVAFGGGRLWVAWDSYNTGAYQIYARQWGNHVEWITRGENFSVRASIAVMPNGVPIVAWEESGPLWGKDYSYLLDKDATAIYRDRKIRVAYRDGRNWRETPDLAQMLPVEVRRFVQQPALAADGTGKLHMAFRVRTSAANSRIDHWASGGRWETYLTALEGDRWTPAVLMPLSVGRNSMRSAVAVANGQVHVAWPADNRVWPGIKYGDLDIYTTSIPAAGAAAKLAGGKPIVADSVHAANRHPSEMVDVRRVRNYRYTHNGKQFRIVRGDLHRHTELSQDGAGDGSLDDLYRYFLDAAAMDYAHVADHQMGTDEEYNWWLTQKSNDLYYIPGRLVPMYGYERSVPYPNGHRNVVWAERGKPVLPIAPAEQKGAVNTGSVLYPYLKQTKGIATSHTSATQQGTDWRDNDPEVEPLVEIYQGFESSYEHAGAPRAWKEGQATIHQGLRPLGFVWNAWAKGYKMGVQASSDHVSTHVSYAMVVTDDYTRQGILDAMRKRHAYAATDNIVVDFRAVGSSGEAMMGDIADSTASPKLRVRVIGTAAITAIHVIKNNEYVHKSAPGKKEASFEFVDTAFDKQENYYYIRIEQADGQLAWSSPIWIRKK